MCKWFKCLFISALFAIQTGCLNISETLFGEVKKEATVKATANFPTGRYNAIPGTVELTFPSYITMSSVTSADFEISDTCAGETATIGSFNPTDQVMEFAISDVAGCTNGETVTVTIDYSDITINSDSIKYSGTQTIVYTLDTSAPTASAAFGGTTGVIASGDYFRSSVPASVSYTFSTDIDLASVTADDFSIVSTGGTDCASMPTVGTLTKSASAYRVTVPLSGGSCSDGESFAIVLAQDSVEDQTDDGTTANAAAPNTGPSADLQINIFIFDSAGEVISVGGGGGSSDGTFKLGDTINIAVTFDQSVDVTGTPRLRLDLTGTKYATYSSGSGSTELIFEYTVVSGDSTSDLDYLATSSLSLNGGTITRANSNDSYDSTLTLPSPGAAGSLSDSNAYVVDGITPTVSSKNPSGGADTWGLGTRDITFTMSEEIDPSSLADGDLTITGGTCAGVPSVTASALSGASNNIITFSLSASTCDDGETYTLSFDPANVTDLNGNTGTGSQEDLLVTTDAAKPSIVLSAPSQSYVRAAGSLTYTVTYSGASSVTLADGDVQFAGASTDCAAVVSGSGTTTRTITISGCSGDGAVQISLAASTAVDAYDNYADAEDESDITDFSADNTELPDPTEDLPTVGANEIYNIDTLSNFTLTFAGDDLGTTGQLQSALSLTCDAGGGANPVSITATRTSATVATVAPNEASPDFVYNSTCGISGTAVPDSAGNTHNFAALTFKVAKNPAASSGPSGTVDLSDATGVGDLGNLAFIHAMDTGTVIPANVTLTCNGNDVAISGLTPSGGDTTFLIDIDESDADWTALTGGDSCTLTANTSVTNSLGIPLTGAVNYNFTTQP